MYTFAIQKNHLMKNNLLIIITSILLATGTMQAQNIFEQTYSKVEIKTDFGDIRIILYDDTPLHRDNFLKLVEEGYYDNQLFHRLIKNFMIQGGDPNSKNASSGELLGQGGPAYTIPAEINFNHFHKKGALAAARKGDQVNPSKASSGSQFYIVHGSLFSKEQLTSMVQQNKHAPFTAEQIEAYSEIGGSPHLDGGYTVFGEIESGIEVLEEIMNIPVDAYDRPLVDIGFTMSVVK